LLAGSFRGRRTINIARVPLLKAGEAPILARDWYQPDGSASALTQSLANAPDLLETLMPFLADILGESSIDLAIKELVIVRVSQLNGCPYCVAAHRPVALASGVSERELEQACDPESRSSLTPRQHAILEWADQVATGAHSANDELVQRLLEHVRVDQVIELTLLVGAVTMLNQYCTALSIPPPVPPP
jgi:AhpD family alkylhydroperoxidase